jgi:hypothetical protein
MLGFKVVVVIATAFGVGVFVWLTHLSDPWIFVLACLGGVGCTYLIELL